MRVVQPVCRCRWRPELRHWRPLHAVGSTTARVANLDRSHVRYGRPYKPPAAPPAPPPRACPCLIARHLRSKSLRMLEVDMHFCVTTPQTLVSLHDAPVSGSLVRGRIWENQVNTRLRVCAVLGWHCEPCAALRGHSGIVPTLVHWCDDAKESVWRWV